MGYDYPQPIGDFNGIVLVGEAPGAEETRLGHPFVGRSGQLLDKMLLSAGIERKKSLIANVFRMQPPANKVDHFFTSKRAATVSNFGIAENMGKFGSSYLVDKYINEINELSSVLAKFQPRVIMALGRTPLWALTGENGLLDKVGKPLSCRLSKGLTVIPTYHPSFILRGNWKLQDEWLSHFKQALEYTMK